jgi:hypothetical protein
MRADALSYGQDPLRYPQLDIPLASTLQRPDRFRFGNYFPDRRVCPVGRPMGLNRAKAVAILLLLSSKHEQKATYVGDGPFAPA